LDVAKPALSRVDDASFVTGIELRVDGGLMLERK